MLVLVGVFGFPLFRRPHYTDAVHIHSKRTVIAIIVPRRGHRPSLRFPCLVLTLFVAAGSGGGRKKNNKKKRCGKQLLQGQGLKAGEDKSRRGERECSLAP